MASILSNRLITTTLLNSIRYSSTTTKSTGMAAQLFKLVRILLITELRTLFCWYRYFIGSVLACDYATNH